MPDDKNGRENQARTADRRRQQRDIKEQLERMDEVEPQVDESELYDFEQALEPLSFPATGAEIVETAGEYTIDAEGRSYQVAELLPDAEDESFEDPEDVRLRIQRPTVAQAMKRVLEASKNAEGDQLKGSQWEAYEKTFRALASIDADDNDEGIDFITDWILEQLDEKDKLPGSRQVRKRATKFCRSNGYQVRNDEWLGA